MSDILADIVALKESLGAPPRRPSNVRLCCTEAQKDEMLGWLHERVQPTSRWPQIPIVWHDYNREHPFPEPGFLIFWSDETMSWTPLDNTTKEKDTP